MHQNIHSKIRQRLRHTLLVASISVLVLPTSAQTVDATKAKDATEDNSPIVLDRFVSVGSRIRNIDSAGPNPVTAIDRTSMETSGFGNVGDALRTLPMMSGISLTPVASNNSFTPGVSTVNVRGLGDNNVLVLLEGRRAVPSAAPGFNGLLTMFDFNSIPESALESIEVLKDGGSAIYGSDAVSGVINIKLRKKFTGLSVVAEVGNTAHTDSLEKSFAIIMGSSQGANSIVTTFDWKERKSIRDADYAFSANANLKNRGGSDKRSYAGYPGLVYVPSLDDYYTLKTPKANPTLADFTVADLSHGSYNFQSVTDQVPATRNYGFYTRGSHDFNPYLYAFAELSFRRSETVIGAAPSPVFNFNENGDGPDGYLNIPATNPNNPFGEDLHDEWYARLVHAGNRINDVTSDTPRALVGLGGSIPDTSWTWETGLLHTSNDVSNLNHGSVFDNLYQNALNGVKIDGQVLYANPFGPEDARVTSYYTHDNPTSASFQLRTWDFNTTGEIVDLPAGPLALALGGEIRTEKFSNNETVANITGNIVGGAEGSSIRGDRNVKAAYAEFRVPIVTGLQLQLAGRFERYSDFGSTTKPKYALSYRPTTWLLLRGSYGQSFLAPNLSYLYSSQVTQFSDQPLDDPKRPQDAARQIVIHAGGNPKLKPETTTTSSGGFSVEPSTGIAKGLSVGVDWLQFKQKDLINQLGTSFLLAHEDSHPGAIVRNPPTAGDPVGIINYINDTYTNTDNQTYRGYDLELGYLLKTKNLGRFHFVANATYLKMLELSGDELAGTYDQPKWRGVFSTDWALGDWSAAIFVSYIGRFDKYAASGTTATASLPSQTLVNPQISYSGLFKTKITLGARNAFDRNPPFDPHTSTGWNADIHNSEKAFVYMRVARDF